MGIYVGAKVFLIYEVGKGGGVCQCGHCCTLASGLGEEGVHSLGVLGVPG